MCLGRHLYWQVSKSITFLSTTFQVNKSVAKRLPCTLASKRHLANLLKKLTYLLTAVNINSIFTRTKNSAFSNASPDGPLDQVQAQREVKRNFGIDKPQIKPQYLFINGNRIYVPSSVLMVLSWWPRPSKNRIKIQMVDVKRYLMMVTFEITNIPLNQAAN